MTSPENFLDSVDRITHFYRSNGSTIAHHEREFHA